jgi:predicted secreted Zn-dependent protease
MGASFAASVGLTTSVVLPRLRRRAARRDADHGLVYFGHLRHRSAADIKRHLRRLDDDEALEQLARQLEATSRVAWRKHARLQAGMLALALGAASLAAARVFL